MNINYCYLLIRWEADYKTTDETTNDRTQKYLLTGYNRKGSDGKLDWVVGRLKFNYEKQETTNNKYKDWEILSDKEGLCKPPDRDFTNDHVLCEWLIPPCEEGRTHMTVEELRIYCQNLLKKHPDYPFMGRGWNCQSFVEECTQRILNL